MPIQFQAIKNFKEGLVTALERQTIPVGAASVSEDWIHKGDIVELRRGSVVKGTKKVGVGKITGLRIGIKSDGTEVLFRTYGQKIEFFDESLGTPDWAEVGTDELGSDADGLEISIEKYNNLAGTFVYIGSPDMSTKKIHVANPSDITDLVTTDFRGFFRIITMAMYLFQRKGSNGVQDNTGLYRSKIDKDEVSDYTEISAEGLDTGDGSTKTFAGTLAFKAGDAKRTCHGVRITDGTETFVDDYSGALVGDLGGTGTINYTTGAYSVTFNTAPAGAQAITGTYYWEDASTDGIVDFSKATPRIGGEGFVIRQDDGGGKFQDIREYDEVNYCLHERKAWALSISADDLTATNNVFREHMGIENRTAAVDTDEGIYFIDSTDQEEPVIRVATLEALSQKVIPKDLSSGRIDLKDYRFDKAEGVEFGEFIVWTFRHKNSDDNNKVLLYDRVFRIFTFCNYWVSHFEVYNGALVGGDSVANNVYELFSGFDDDESDIVNDLQLGDLTHGLEGLKKTKILELEGLIQSAQKIKVSLAFDNNDAVEVGGSDAGTPSVHTYAIEGDGDYVDAGQSIGIGKLVIGSTEIGGGSGGEVAHPFKKEITINTDRYHYARPVFEAVGIGYVALTKIEFKDIRYKGRKVPLKYR